MSEVRLKNNRLAVNFNHYLPLMAAMSDEWTPTLKVVEIIIRRQNFSSFYALTPILKRNTSISKTQNQIHMNTNSFLKKLFRKYSFDLINIRKNAKSIRIFFAKKLSKTSNLRKEYF